MTQQDTSVDEVEIEYVDNDTATERLREMAVEAVEQPESENVKGQGLFG